MGKANVGYLVGVGCTVNFCCNTFYYLSNYYFYELSFENRIVREKVVAIFILVGSVNLPIVKFSVDWWNTLHQPATISKLSKPSIDPSMMTPLIIMTFAFIMIGLAIAILRIKTEIISRKLNLS